MKIYIPTDTISLNCYSSIFQIFHGRQSYRELYEFTEDLLAYTRKLALSPYGFGNRAAAVYLLYTLYFKQPCRPKVRIRVEYEQYEDFCQWIDELRSGHNILWFVLELLTQCIQSQVSKKFVKWLSLRTAHYDLTEKNDKIIKISVTFWKIGIFNESFSVKL